MAALLLSLHSKQTVWVILCVNFYRLQFLSRTPWQLMCIFPEQDGLIPISWASKTDTYFLSKKDKYIFFEQERLIHIFWARKTNAFFWAKKTNAYFLSKKNIKRLLYNSAQPPPPPYPKFTYTYIYAYIYIYICSFLFIYANHLIIYIFFYHIACLYACIIIDLVLEKLLTHVLEGFESFSCNNWIIYTRLKRLFDPNSLEK